MPKKLTNKEFIEKANKVHNHKYSYPDEYINSATKIKIICPIHGEFLQSPNSHLRSEECAKCGRINSSYNNIYKHKKTFYIKANKVHNNKYEYPDEYVNAHTKLKIICPVHGAFLQSPNGHLRGSGCGVCSNNIKLTSKKFIKKANEVHNNKYTYSDEYVNAHTKLKIICPVHGAFYQRPNGHLAGSGCVKCTNVEKISTPEFIQKANEVHNNKYSYPDEYVNNHSKIKIICPVHGEFYQKPKYHLKGGGCQICSGRKKPTTPEFILKANEVHNNKYSYPDEYINSQTKIKIICPVHGEFYQKPASHTNKKYGCPKCSNNKKLTSEIFIEHANNIHNQKYSYPDEYINSKNKIKIICPIHGEFYQRPNDHTNKEYGCPQCSNNNKKLTTERFIEHANNIHNQKYSYPDEYINSKNKIKIICPIHGEFYQRPNGHLAGNGCTKCSLCGYSKVAISWLNEIAKKGNIHIQHAENKGEYSIPGTNYKADGYCEANNTIYEFYGDIWHGNLELYNENEQCHPFSNESAGSLYMKTMQREQIIKNLGYNLITIWEHDFV